MAHGFKTGGRQKGTPNKTTLAVKEALSQCFDEMGGIQSLRDWGKENPTEFYKLWVKMLPTEIKAEVSAEIEPVGKVQIEVISAKS